MAESYSFQAQGACLEKQPVVVIQNNGTRSYQVSRLVMEPRIGNTAGGYALNYFTLCKISGYVNDGGFVCGFTARRSGAAGIDAAIEVVANPSSVTLGSVLGYGNLAPVNANAPKFNELPQFGKLHTINQNRQLNGCCFGDILKSCRKGQPITLAAGEGVVWSQATRIGLSGYPARTSVEVEVLVGGETYSVVVPVGSPLMSDHRLVIFNKAGSGVSCQITRVCEVQDNYGINRSMHTTPTYGQPCIPQLVVARVAKTPHYNYVAGNNKTVPVVGMQSGGAGETELACFIGTRTPDMEVYGDELESLMTALQATGFPPNGTAAHYRAACQANAFRSLPIKDVYFRGDGSWFDIGKATVRRGVVWEAKRGIGLCLGPGESLVVRSMGSDYLDAVIGGEISVIGSPTYPAVGDVDAGVQYGPNATDYTGTLEQPAITDVLSGVQYGAGGTEFTGTATGGGGGSGVSRGRVTNA